VNYYHDYTRIMDVMHMLTYFFDKAGSIDSFGGKSRDVMVVKCEIIIIRVYVRVCEVNA